MNKRIMFVLAVVIIISMIMGGLQVAIAEPSAEPKGQGAAEGIDESLVQVGESDKMSH